MYKEGRDPSVQAAIEVAKTVCERRRCGHHPESHPEPLSTLECLSSVVDPGKNGINKHRYCVASQEQEVRSAMRKVQGVPLIYVSRSVMILEPMAEATRRVCESGEKGKLRDGFVRSDRKRKRAEEDEKESGSEGESGDEGAEPQEGEKKNKKKKTYGKKQPNPLAVQKKKKPAGEEKQQPAKAKEERKEKKEVQNPAPATTEAGAETGSAETKPKRKRIRKNKATAGGEGGSGGAEGGEGGNEAGASSGGGEAVQAESKTEA